jgi:hypothetical protein
MEETNKEELLPLDAPERVAVIQSRGKIYRHIFRKITPQDWEGFFTRIVAEFQQEKSGYSHVIDTDIASLHLYAKTVRRVEGYATRDGRDPTQIPSWPECIPQDHRLRASAVLTDVKLDMEAEESMLEVDTIPVAVSALWNEAEAGAMKQYRGLIHRFRIPSEEQRRRYLKAKSRAFVAGGSRRGVTVIPSSHPVLVRLYDELIESAEGYGVRGAPLLSREQIAQEMDAFHKVAAVGRLFPVNDRGASAVVDMEDQSA